MNKKRWVIGLLLVLVLLLAACDEKENQGGLQEEQRNTSALAQQYTTSQPVPYFEWSLERHIMIELFRARNEAVSTFSVVINPYNNTIIFACPSIGFPIPGGTQLTNPEQLTWVKPGGSSSWVSGNLPMMEPNGLYTPSTSANTYVMCVNADGTVSPIYVEWYVLTFPFPVEIRDGQLVMVEGTQPSLSIKTTQ